MIPTSSSSFDTVLQTGAVSGTAPVPAPDPDNASARRKALHAAWPLPSRPLDLAVPSWVFPGTMRDNAAFLRGRVAEMGLCCFERAASLVMDEADLPALSDAVGGANLRFHVHLPLDLWEACPGQGEDPAQAEAAGREAATTALVLMHKLAPLRPRMAVLHPPLGPKAAPALAAFFDLWTRELPAALLAVENIKGQDLRALAGPILASGCGICLDAAHLVAYAQEALLDCPDLLARVTLTHWSAPGAPRGEDRHQGLDRLDPATLTLFRRVARLTPRVRPLVEVFDWRGVLASLPVLEQLEQ